MPQPHRSLGTDPPTPRVTVQKTQFEVGPVLQVIVRPLWSHHKCIVSARIQSMWHKFKEERQYPEKYGGKGFLLCRVQLWRSLSSTQVSEVLPTPAVSASPGNSLEKQILGSCPGPTESETLDVGPRSLCFNQPSRCPVHTNL